MRQLGTGTEISAPLREGTGTGVGTPLEGLQPPGWVLLRDCTISATPWPPVQVPLVLLHPEVGVALLETGPSPTPELEAILRRRLEVARFTSIFAGHLPVLHRRIPPDELSRIANLLAEGFAALPPLTVPGGEAWVGVVRRALLPRDSVVPRHALPEVPEEADARAPQEPEGSPPSRPALHRLAATRPAEEVPSTESEEAPAAPARRRRTWQWAAGLGVAALAGVLAIVLGITGRETPLEQAEAPPSLAGASPAPSPADPAQPPAGSPAMREPARPVPVVPAPPSPAAGREAALPNPGQPAPAAPRATAAAPSPASALVRTRANLRNGPSDRATVLRVLPRGQNLRVLDRAPGGWVHVGDPQPIGWVHGSLLDETS